MRYYLDFGTGAGDHFVDCDLDEAKKIADDGAAYTQCQYCIREVDQNDVPGKVVCYRPWWGVAYDSSVDSDDDVITFGSFGYFGSWQSFD